MSDLFQCVKNLLGIAMYMALYYGLVYGLPAFLIYRACVALYLALHGADDGSSWSDYDGNLRE
jgi:hypothetical protein